MNLVFEKFESFLESVKEITSAKLMEAINLLQNEGKDISDISNIFVGNNGELVDILPDGTLVKLNLYIATKNIDRYSLNTLSSKDLYKYHIYKCSTISQMFNAQRKHRYKVNSRDDGTFFFIFNDYNGNILKKEKFQKLDICKNCLKKFQNTYPSDYDVAHFNLKRFHNQNSSFFAFDTSELEKGEDARPNVYSQQWREISTQLKTKRDYTCENCGWKPNNAYHKKFVHTHHQNGDKTNNGKENLKVLCIECHSNVDGYHGQIKSQSNYKEFIEAVR
jgi:hypothetical protein